MNCVHLQYNKYIRNGFKGMDAELLKYAWNNYPKCKENVSWYNYFYLQTDK